MSEMERIGELEIDQDLHFQKRMWLAQRVGWAVMALVALAALGGLLGTGPLSRTTVGERSGPLQVEFHRFERYRKPTSLRVTVAGEAITGSEARLWLDRSYLEAFQVQRVTPQPSRVEAAANRLIYVFDVAQPGQPVTVVFDVQAETFGSRQGAIGLDTGSPLTFRQLVYP